MLLLKLKGNLNFHMVQVATLKAKMLMLAKFPIFFCFPFQKVSPMDIEGAVDRENRAEIGGWNFTCNTYNTGKITLPKNYRIERFNF